MAKENSGGCWPQWQENKLFALLLAILMVYGIVFVGVLIKKNLMELRKVGIADRQPSIITVTATDKADTAPTIATLSLGVTNTAATSEKAAADNAAKSNAMIAGIKALGIAAADIQTSNYSVNPAYDYNVSPAKVVGYDANETVTVKIRDTSKASEVTQKAISLGATNVGGLQYTVEDSAAVEAAARAKAISKAYDQAAAIAKAMRAKLGGVISYSEYDNGGGPIIFAQDSSFGRGGAESSPALEPGTSEFSKTVTIEFSIE